MKVQLIGSAVLLLSAASAHPMALSFGETLEVMSCNEQGERIYGAVYGVYMDEQCREALTGKDGTPLCTDDDHPLVLKNVQEEVWLKEITAPCGYYADPCVHAVQEGELLQIVHEPIVVETLLSAEKEAYLMKQEECAASWKDGTWQTEEGLFCFQAGETYDLKAVPEEWVYEAPVSIAIPFWRESEEPVRIAAESKEYGILSLDEAYAYRIYEDAQAKQTARQIDGRETDGSCCLKMEEGTYYIQTEGIPETYYREDALQEVTVEKRKENRFGPSLIRPLCTLQASDALSNEEIEEGSWVFRDEETGASFTQRGNVPAALKRSHTYTVHFVPDSGCYPSKEQTITVPAEKTDLSLTAVCAPILLSLHAQEEESGGSCPEAVFSVLNELGETLYEGTGDTLHLRHLKAGETCRVFLADKPAGFLGGEEVSLTIPAEEGSLPSVCFSLKPYVHVQLDESIEGSFTLFEDEEGLYPALDIHGQPAADCRQADLFNGTYYAKLSDLPLTYYEPEGCERMQISRQNGYGMKYCPDLMPVTLKVVSKEEGKNNPMVGVSYVLRDEEDRDIRSWISSGEEVVKGVLERGKAYELLCESAPGLYTYEHEPQRIVFPKYAPKEEKTIELSYRPYAGLLLKTLWEQGAVSDVKCRLFCREEGMEIVEDIHGLAAEGTSDEEGTVRFSLYPGEYWGAMTSGRTDVLLPEKRFAVTVGEDGWSFEETLPVRLCSFSFCCENEEAKAVKGGVYVLCREDGSEAARFTAEEDMTTVQGTYLQKGSSYTLRMEEAPEGYEKTRMALTFRMPDHFEEDMPVLHMSVKAKAKTVFDAKPKSETVEPESPEDRHHSFTLVLPCGGAAAFLAGLMRKNRGRNLQ